MSEQAMETDGNPAEAAPPAGGSSFLGDLARKAEPVDVTTPDGSVVKGDTAESVTQDAIDGPPEYVPEKFWKKDSKEVDVEALGTGYKNLEKLLSRDKVPVPQGEDDTEGLERWFAAVRPESEEAYDFGDADSSMPDGLSYDSELEQSYRNAAFANGLHPKQAKAFHDMFVKIQVERHQQYEKMVAEKRANLTNELSREYGREMPAVQKRVGQVLVKYGDPDFEEYLAESGVGDDPRMVRFMDRVAKDMSGERRLIGKPTQVAQPADLDTAIAQFNSKHQKALFDNQHPDHNRLVQERQRLYEARFGDSA